MKTYLVTLTEGEAVRYVTEGLSEVEISLINLKNTLDETRDYSLAIQSVSNNISKLIQLKMLLEGMKEPDNE